MYRVRIGILGGGGIVGAHAPAYQRIKELCEVVAVAEPDVTRHERLRKLLGEQLIICGDYAEVVNLPQVDAVDIVLPHVLHLPATKKAAAAGKPVLVEKVMARNIHECDEMIAACDEAGVTLTVCHDRRYDAKWMALKEIVDSGMLGEVFYWKLEHNQNVVFPEGSWVRSRAGLGGGAIMSCLTHQIDSLRWYGGEFDSVSCMTRVIPERMEGEAVGVIIGQMKSGALANLSINWFTRSNGPRPNELWYELVHVCGTKGEAYFMSSRGTFVMLHDRTNEAALARFGEAVLDGFVEVPCGDWNGHERCIAEWVKHLRGEESTLVTSGREVRGTVEVAEAAYRSAKTGQAVKLPIEALPWDAQTN